MTKNKKSSVDKENVKRSGGRQRGAKSYNTATLFKLIKRYKPTNSVLWNTVADQYRVECGELESRSAQ